MAVIRGIFKAFLLSWWLFIIWVCLSLSSIGNYWKAQRRLAAITKIWGNGLAWIFNIKVKVNGYDENFKSGLVISNHTGYVDILVHAGVWPLRFAAKNSIRYWPFIGWFVSSSRPIWIDRTSRQKSKIAAKQFKDSMENDVLLLVYPEGTSTSGKEGMVKFKSTPFEAAVKGDNWILPSIIRYGNTPDNEPVAWYDDMTLLPHLWRILCYREIAAEVTIMEPFKPEGRNRKELARFAQERMEEEYKKVFASGDIVI